MQTKDIEEPKDRRDVFTILVLHGYMQNKLTVSRPLKKLLKPTPQVRVRVIIPEGPFIVQNTDKPVTEQSVPRGWWLRPTNSLTEPFSYDGLDESVRAVENALEGADVDMVVGFSQGSVFGTLLLAMGKLPKCKSAVFYGASGVQDPHLAATITNKITVPALFVQGTKDPFCSMEDARQLGAYYTDTTYDTHKWGHVIPSDATSRDSLWKFRMWNNKSV